MIFIDGILFSSIWWKYPSSPPTTFDYRRRLSPASSYMSDATLSSRPLPLLPYRLWYFWCWCSYHLPWTVTTHLPQQGYNHRDHNSPFLVIKDEKLTAYSTIHHPLFLIIEDESPLTSFIWPSPKASNKGAKWALRPSSLTQMTPTRGKQWMLGA